MCYEFELEADTEKYTSAFEPMRLSRRPKVISGPGVESNHV